MSNYFNTILYINWAVIEDLNPCTNTPKTTHADLNGSQKKGKSFFIWYRPAVGIARQRNNSPEQY